MKSLEDREKRLAEITAHVIAKADDMHLPDTPDKLVSAQALRLLAIAHIELLGQVHEIHDRIDQIARVAIEGAIREIARQQGGIATAQIVDEAKSEGMLAAQPFISALPRRSSGGPPSAQKRPQLVLTPNQIAKLTAADLIALYCRTMNEMESVFIKHESYIVRVWDGMDGCWTNCTAEVGREEALRYWAEKTDGGTRRVAFAEIDYYKIFPGGTRMTWDGSEGREMFR
jgi:hypothetical protein